MKEMKLISMVDFVLRETGHQDHVTSFIQCCRYANFLKQPLELCMFVPCDEDGNVLEEPKEVNYETPTMYEADWQNWRIAKERILFEGCTIEDYGNRFHIMLGSKSGIIYAKESGNFSSPTIEYLQEYNLTLTPTALKQIGL